MKGKKPKKKVPPVKPQSPYPTDWLYLSPEAVPVRTLRDYFLTLPDVDVECWPDLGVLELTFPDKHYIDFEAAPLDLGDPESNQLVSSLQAQTVFYVSVEPICSASSLDVLRAAAAALGGRFVADNQDFQPVLS